MPHPHPWSRGLPPLAHPGQVPTIQLRVRITFSPLPGATVPVWVMTARRERGEDAWHGGCCQPAPGKAAPLPDWCPSPGLPPSGSSTWGPGFIRWLAPVKLSPPWLFFCPDRQPHPSPSPPGCLAPLSVCSTAPSLRAGAGNPRPHSPGACGVPQRTAQPPRTRAATALFKSSNQVWWKQEAAPVQERKGSSSHPLPLSWAPSWASLAVMGHPLPKATQSCLSPSYCLSILRKLWLRNCLNTDALADPQSSIQAAEWLF